MNDIRNSLFQDELSVTLVQYHSLNMLLLVQSYVSSYSANAHTSTVPISKDRKYGQLRRWKIK